MSVAVDDVAAAILARTGQITTWKLQKLAYYAQAWHLVKYGTRLFVDDFEAWAQGPVVRVLYNQHRRRNRVSDWPSGDQQNLSQTERVLLDWVIDQYGSFTAESLSRMSHIEAPWLLAREALPAGTASSNVISAEIMQTFYARQVASSEDAVTIAVANSYIEGVELDEEWQERLRSVAEGKQSADALVAEEIRRIRGD
ncbi:MAG: Panacea domain-containing protein [Pseudonocardia sp.]